MTTCTIIAGGDLAVTSEIRKAVVSSQLIICADGGARYFRQMNILPHVLVGDFDSIQPDDKAYFIKKGVPCIEYPPKKDQTDSELCVRWAIKQHVTDITFLGATGSRMDHTLANIFLLKRLSDKNITARIINRNNEIYLVRDHLEIEGEPGDLLSILPVSDTVGGVTLTGLEYTLENKDLQMGSSLGISNRFLHRQATICVKRGILIVTKSRD